MSEAINCAKCGKVEMGDNWYRLADRRTDNFFCSRVCLVEFIAPELKQVAVIKQWVPTPEEEKRMSEEST